VGVPLLFAYLLLVRFRGTLEKQCDKEQLASETKKAAKHVDRLHERREEAQRKSTASQQTCASTSSRRLSVGRAVVAKLQQQTDLARVSSCVSEAGTDASADGEETAFGTTAVWKETAKVLDDLEATYLGFLLNPYLLSCFWQRCEPNQRLHADSLLSELLAAHRFEVFECARKVALVGFPVFFVDDSLEQLMIGLVVCFVSVAVFSWFKPYREPSDNTLQMLCQVGIFFALLSKIILDHPDMTDTQSSVLGVLLVVLVLIPLVITLLHALLDPGEPVADAFGDPMISMVPGAERLKRALEKSSTKHLLRVAPEHAAPATSQTEKSHELTDLELFNDNVDEGALTRLA
jgi:hypothetical protein